MEGEDGGGGGRALDAPSAPAPPRAVLVVEDMPETRDWLVLLCREAFGEDVQVECAGDLRAARRWLAARTASAPGLVVLLDLGLPDGSGLELIDELRAPPVCARVVVTTVFDDDDNLMSAMAAGAEGYLLKDRDRAQLADLLRRLDRDEAPMSPVLARRILDAFRRQASARVDPSGGALTGREAEVLRLIGRGLIVREVADVLSVSPHTVASHVKSIYAKLGIGSRAEAALEAARRNLA